MFPGERQRHGGFLTRTRRERERERDGEGGRERETGGRVGDRQTDRQTDRVGGLEREHVEGRHIGLVGSEWCARDGKQAGSEAGGQRK